MGLNVQNPFHFPLSNRTAFILAFAWTAVIQLCAVRWKVLAESEQVLLPNIPQWVITVGALLAYALGPTVVCAFCRNGRGIVLANAGMLAALLGPVAVIALIGSPKVFGGWASLAQFVATLGVIALALSGLAFRTFARRRDPLTETTSSTPAH